MKISDKNLAVVLAERQKAVADDTFSLALFALVVTASVFIVEMSPTLDPKSNDFSKTSFSIWGATTLLIIFLCGAFWQHSIGKSLQIVNGRLPSDSELRLSPKKEFLPYLISLFCVGGIAWFVSAVWVLFPGSETNKGISLFVLFHLLSVIQHEIVKTTKFKKL